MGTKMKHEIVRVLVVSTAHITQVERDRLFGHDGLPARAQYVGEFGAQVWVPKEGGILEDENGNESDSEGLRGCLKIARAQRCNYVLFDSDGGGYSHLPDYDAIEDAKARARKAANDEPEDRE